MLRGFVLRRFVPAAMGATLQFGRFSQPNYLCGLISPQLSAVSINTMQSRHLKTNAYDVFVSFRGKDIRGGFLSHLVEDFNRKKINAFVDDKLKRGHEIPPSLIEGIEGSLISLVIFSQDYASSHWCLEELVTIHQCREKYGQIVIPVFYLVDPTNVRHQTGSYESAFVEHEKKYDSTKVTMWRHALNESANLSGIKSSDFGNDALLLQEIIKTVLMYLSNKQRVNSKGLVGIDKPIAHVNSLLCQESNDVRVIGIWGMGGVGKTTIAEEVFHQICYEYDGCCFLSKVREELARHGAIFLKEKLFSTLLAEHVNLTTANGLPGYVKARVGRMKVLIVLDDVNDLDQLQIFVGDHHWFGAGSRIIITTRDKQLLSKDVDDIYEVGTLDHENSLELFSLTTFKHKQLEMEYFDMSNSFVNYAKGLPLVLKVLGHLLREKDKEIWVSLLWKLRKMPNKEVFDVMRLSFDDLDRNEQKIFLDLACFYHELAGFDVNFLKECLKDGENDNSIADGLERLKDKALIYTSKKKGIHMHDIIQEMAMEIVRKESTEDPRRRSRLWDPDEIYKVLKNDKGTEAIRMLTAELSVLKKLKLSPSVFAKMSNLQFLSFHGGYDPDGFDYLPEGLQSMPPQLKCLRWEHCPLKSLPEKFSTERLVILFLEGGQVEKLWDGVQNLINLKQLVLLNMKHLKQLSSFSKATNLEGLIIRYCQYLTELPRDLHLSSLKFANLEGCIGLKNLSEVLESSIELNLQSKSVNALIKLEYLNLSYCPIESLPSCLENLTRLKGLHVAFCMILQILPELPRSLEVLSADGCLSLKTVIFPSIAEQFKENRKQLWFFNCFNLDKHSLMNIALNVQINVMKSAYQNLSYPIHDFDEEYDEINPNSSYFKSVHIYPGSRVPEWFVYKTTKDYIVIDLSLDPCPPVSTFIFCFILGKFNLAVAELKFTINISAGEGEDETHLLEMRVRGMFNTSITNHVYVMNSPQCSSFLRSIAKNMTRLKLRAEVSDITHTEVGEASSPGALLAAQGTILLKEVYRLSLLNFYATHGFSNSACQVFAKIPEQKALLWN